MCVFEANEQGNAELPSAGGSRGLFVVNGVKKTAALSEVAREAGWSICGLMSAFRRLHIFQIAYSAPSFL